MDPFKAANKQSTSTGFVPIQPKVPKTRNPGYTLVQSPNGYTIQQTFSPQAGFANPPQAAAKPNNVRVQNPQQGFAQNPVQRGFQPSPAQQPRFAAPRPNPNPNPVVPANPVVEQESVAQDRIDYDYDYSLDYMDYSQFGREGEFFVPAHFKVYDAVPL